MNRLRKEKEQEEGDLSVFTESASRIRDGMASSQKKAYGPPAVPETPSSTINNMLHTRCGKTHDNVFKAVVAYYICHVFTAINKLYDTIYHDKNRPSHTMWMVSCGVVSLAIVLKALLVYNIVMATSFLVHYALYYSSVLLALGGTGLGVAGMVFFDKPGSQPKQHGSSTTTTSTTSKVSSSYNAQTTAGDGSLMDKQD